MDIMSATKGRQCSIVDKSVAACKKSFHLLREILNFLIFAKLGAFLGPYQLESDPGSLQHAVFHRVARQPCGGRDAKLALDILAVGFDGAHRDIQG